MKFFPYQLANCAGALIQLTCEDGSIGYADCYPWENLGDLPLNEQLNLLQKGITTPLTARSLHFARLDAEARSRGVSLFEGLQVPDSHFLMLDVWQPLPPERYKKVKIKLGKNLAQETEKLLSLLPALRERNCFIRLDFNCQLSRRQFELFLHAIDREMIEFCEDPFPYEPREWAEVQKSMGVALACDFGSERAVGHAESAAYLVLKPAVQEPFTSSNQKIVATSYLDHPLGQMTAAYVAGKLPGQGVECGLLSHLVYPPNPFSAFLSEGPGFLPPPGTGFGFDELLKKVFAAEFGIVFQQ